MRACESLSHCRIGTLTLAARLANSVMVCRARQGPGNPAPITATWGGWSDAGTAACFVYSFGN